MKIAFVLLALVLTGCAVAPTPSTIPYQEPPKPPEGMATLVIYREESNAGILVPHSYFINGKYVGSLYMKTYTFVYIQRGPTTVVWSNVKDKITETGARPQQINAQVGNIYFYKEKVTQLMAIPLLIVTMLRYSMETSFVPPQVAREELQSYKFLQADVPRL